MDDKNPGELLQEPAEIYRALRALQLTRSLVTVKIDNDPQIYSSMILLCDLDNRQFIIDEVRPATGNIKLENGQNFTLMGFYEGIQVLCKDNHVALRNNTQELDNAFSVPFPNYVYRKQRRDSFRTALAASLPTSITLSSKNREKKLSGVITDISVSGIGCEIPGYVRPELNVGEVFEAATISINSEFHLTCELVVRHPYFNKGANLTHCGLQFSNIDPVTQKKLDRYTLSLQRQARRRTKQDNELKAQQQLKAG